MSSWQTVKTVLDEALDQPPDERPRFLAETCGSDEELLRAVEELLALEDESGDFLGEPIFSLADPPATEDPNLGRRVGAFRLVERLAAGGMGAVYLGERADGPFQQKAAVKLIKRGMDSEEILRRFALERQILARLSHDSIARLLDGGTADDGLPYFALEYVEGLPLDRYVAEHNLDLDTRLKLFLEVCDAVAFAHRNLVIHRDLKPGNILVTAEGRPKLLDFGISKLLTPEGTPDGAATLLGVVPMTPAYASPEQLKSQALTTATDVYSLGVILYELLTGAKPRVLDTQSAGAWLSAIEAKEPPRPSMVAPLEARARLKGDLDRIVAKAMAADAAERYGSVAELAEDLSLFREGLPIRSRPQTWSYRSAKFLRRHKLGVGVAAAFVALLIGATTAMAMQRRQIAQERDRVTEERDRARAAEDLFTAIFEDAAKQGKGGQDLTAAELLATGAQKVKSSTQQNPKTLAVQLDALGRAYRQLGYTQESVAFLQSALEIRRQSLPAGDALLGETLNNLALALRQTSEFEQAEELLAEAVRILRAAVARGEARRQVLAAALSNLASVLDSQGKLEEVPSLFAEALAIKRELSGENSPDFARTLNNLAGAHFNLGEYTQAEPMLRRALAIRLSQHGLGAREEVLTSLNNLALLLLETGRLAEARPVLEEDWTERRVMYAEKPERLSIGWTSQGLLAQQEGRFVDARDAFLQALTLANQSGSGAERAAANQRNLAVVLGDQPQLGDCEPYARAAAAYYQTKKAGTWQEADATNVLGGCLLAKGGLREAEPLLIASYETLKTKTKRRPFLSEARARLVELYTKTGRAEMAKQLEAEAAP